MDGNRERQKINEEGMETESGRDRIRDGDRERERGRD